MITPSQVDIVVAIGIITNPRVLKKEMLIIKFIKTIKDEILNGVMVLSLAKKKFANIFKIENAGMPYPKYFRARAVILISFSENEP